MKDVSLNVKKMIYEIRGLQVMLDSDLAVLYEVEVRALNQAVKRNANRFPEDFVFQLTEEDLDNSGNSYLNLKSQIVISSYEGHGGRRHFPYAFTEQGVAMLASVLKSQKAAETSIAIMRAFVNMRKMVVKMAASAIEIKELKQMLLLHIDNTNSHLKKHSKKITEIITVLNLLTEKPEPKRKPIGFVPSSAK